MNNVFKLWYRPSYYFRHPIKFFKEVAANLKAAWMRATKGYCYTDVWNIDTWFCLVLPPMLRHMADYGSAYPGSEPFETPEKWHDWLHSVADVIETFNDEDFWYTTKNEFAEEWDKVSKEARVEVIDDLGHKMISYNKSDHYNEIKELYFARMKEISKERQALIENTFNELGKYFDCLWD